LHLVGILLHILTTMHGQNYIKFMLQLLCMLISRYALQTTFCFIFFNISYIFDRASQYNSC